MQTRPTSVVVPTSPEQAHKARVLSSLGAVFLGVGCEATFKFSLTVSFAVGCKYYIIGGIVKTFFKWQNE